MRIFINGGTGVVGSRLIRTLPSVINCDLVIGAKSADPGELSQFERLYPTYLPDERFDHVAALARRRGMNVVGRHSELEFSRFDAVIDTAPHDFVQKYRSSTAPFIVLGKSRWRADVFASLPGRGVLMRKEFKQVSASETAAGIFISALLSCYDSSDISKVRVYDNGRMQSEENNLVTIFPKLRGRIEIVHGDADAELEEIKVEVTINNSVKNVATGPLRALLSAYERCVLIDPVDKDVGRVKMATRVASTRANIENADALLPIFMVDEPQGQVIRACAVVPWRSATIPSLLDYVAMVTYSGLTASQIVSHVNRSASWFGHTIVALKQLLTKEIASILDK